MGRKSAAQIAQEELEKAQAAQAEKEKATSGSTEGEISQAGTITQEEANDATSGDSGAGNGGDSGEEEALVVPDAPKHEKTRAVTLRVLPGLPIGIGCIISAPVHMIKSWDEISWVDTHENALEYAERAYLEKKRDLAMARPGAPMPYPLITELNDIGEIVESSDEE